MIAANRDIQRPSARRWRRRAVRWIALAAAVVLVLPPAGRTPWLLALPSLSPFVAFGAWLGGSPWTVVTLAAGVTVILCILWRRFFCRYFCPLGLLLDCAALASFRKPDVRRVPRIGRVLVLSTWAGAVVGVPLFLWLDPLSLFSALFGNRHQDWLWTVPAAVVLISILVPRIWCTRVCPLGATQDLLRLPADLCRRVPKLAEPSTVDAQGPAEPRPLWSRRTVLASLGGVVAGLAGLGGGRVLSGRFARAGQKLRPPGAIREDRFLAMCIRCGNCLQACPSEILHADLSLASWESLATPVLVFRDGYCREDCRACLQVCPSGAIRRLGLKEKLEYKIGLAAVEFDLCLLAYDRECEICQRACPREAVDFRWSDEEYTVIPLIDAERCNGCGGCLIACPGENDWEREADPMTPVRKAIRIEPLAPVRPQDRPPV